MTDERDGDGGEGAGPIHPRRDLDDLLTHAVRFSIVAALAGVEKAEFAAVRDTVEISDATLSKQAALLEKAGYVRVEKGRVGRRPRTWLSLSDEGTATYARHVAALRAIAGLAG
ncbi:DNA-binding transcriptional regulator, MarR family [Micromonospora pattaloongensis]|uniref:DNA-binding transcriptional regulator, MarR family n=1 Tax=Micromonospora pattaloongensis TaxID=405436 RepID=A0A1H3MST2_9ACTN|nr:transcriptional regulator [Micromonospora pattaloongensis]SDY79534.1 DNA-binding transcriptional regulator, MarR family [Micromonospora pattaloongensis]